jgi:hypothetical protein
MVVHGLTGTGSGRPVTSGITVAGRLTGCRKNQNLPSAMGAWLSRA